MAIIAIIDLRLRPAVALRRPQAGAEVLRGVAGAGEAGPGGSDNIYIYIYIYIYIERERGRYIDIL